jgi:deazaflavin-dependent oxidoreductase (nitroreductase family)
MARPYKLGIFRKGFNAVAETALRFGIATPGAYILTTIGRKSGKERSTPVQLVETDGSRYLVAAYGRVSWVHNARAAGKVRISRGKHSEELSIEELSPERAAPILKRYVRKVPIVLPYFDAKRDSPLEAFESEAANHPVFRLT